MVDATRMTQWNERWGVVGVVDGTRAVQWNDRWGVGVGGGRRTPGTPEESRYLFDSSSTAQSDMVYPTVFD